MAFNRTLAASFRLAATLERVVVARPAHSVLLRSPKPTYALRRAFTASAVVRHNDITPPRPGEELHITFVDKDGERHTLEVAAGDNLLDIAQAHDLEMEGEFGNCGGRRRGVVWG